MTLICKSAQLYSQVSIKQAARLLETWEQIDCIKHLCKKKGLALICASLEPKREVMLTIEYHNDCAIYTAARPPAVSFRIG